MAQSRQTVELKGMTLEELEAFAERAGEPRYRGREIAHWLYQRGATSFAEMTDLPAPLRAHLAEDASVASLSPVTALSADGGDTIKYLLGLSDGNTIETVFMRYQDGRRSVCISTQVGCGMGCTFCATGLAGLTRNLSAAEIIDQVLLVHRTTGERVTNVVFMGMGEPLANYEATLRAIRLLSAPYGLGIGMRHLTVSTVGLVPQIRALAGGMVADDAPPAGIPVGESHGELPQGGRSGYAFHVNLIPWNPVYGLQYQRPDRERVAAFVQGLRERGIPTTVRLERGVDIDAACGQLQRTHGATAPGNPNPGLAGSGRSAETRERGSATGKGTANTIAKHSG